MTDAKREPIIVFAFDDYFEVGRDDMSMKTREWTTLDKRAWGPGPWMDEPDKIQWMDAGYPCLMVRNRGGAWCGYVGVPRGHPLYGSARMPSGEPDVHGGLTYAGSGADLSPEAWEQWRKRQLARVNLREYTAAIDDYAAYVVLGQSRSICYVPEPGELDNVWWWFGFDCAHLGDVSPLDRWCDGGVYRDRAYVEREVAKLAAQLADIAGRGVMGKTVREVPTEPAMTDAALQAEVDRLTRRAERAERSLRIVGEAIGCWDEETGVDVDRARELHARIAEAQPPASIRGLDPDFTTEADARRAVAAVIEAARKLRAEVSSLHIEAVREGLGNTNAAVLKQRAEEFDAALDRLGGA